MEVLTVEEKISNKKKNIVGLSVFLLVALNFVVAGIVLAWRL